MPLSILFIDVRKNFTEEKNITDNHFFGEVKKGLNIYGICSNKKCQAYKKEVVISFTENKIFDMLLERNSLECPVCGRLISPKTIGFNFCEYQIEGVIYENDTMKDFIISGQSINTNIIQNFNPEKCGMAIFIQLRIKVFIYF